MKYLAIIVLLVGCAAEKHEIRFVNLASYEENMVLKAFQRLSKPIDINLTIKAANLEEGIEGNAPIGSKNCLIQLDYDIFKAKQDYVSRVVLHEYGHCKGLEHSEKKCSIMAAEVCNKPLTDDLVFELEREF